MSVSRRYLRSRRRRPTSSSRPRRLWWSCWCTLRCSFRSLILRVMSAIWTSGEPVSPSLIAYSAKICFLTSVSSGTWLLRIVLRDCGFPVGDGRDECAALRSFFLLPLASDLTRQGRQDGESSSRPAGLPVASHITTHQQGLRTRREK